MTKRGVKRCYNQESEKMKRKNKIYDDELKKSIAQTMQSVQ